MTQVDDRPPSRRRSRTAPVAAAGLVARRRRLPGLRAELRRRQRRRHRRPRRRPGPAAVSARARRRRALVQPLVPLAAGRQRLRHRRLPRDRPGVRDARRGGGADRGGARARHPHDRRRRPEPRLERAPLVPRGARGRPGSRRALALLVPARARRATARSRRTAGSRSSAGRPGRAWTTASGTSISSRPSSPTSTGRTRTSGPSTRRAALLVRPRRRRRAHRLGRAADQGSGARRGESDPRRASTRSWIATSCTRSIAAGARSPTATRSRGVLVGEIWLPDAERLVRYLRPDELHTAFNFDFLACPWEPRALRASIDAALASHAADRRAADVGALEPRRHPSGHALRARGHVVLVRGEARRTRRPTWPAAPAAPARQRCSRWRFPARCTSTRARSSACPRSRTSRTDLRRDPMHGALGRRRSRPRRVPRPDPVVRVERPPYGFSERRGSPLARPARRLGAAHRRGAGRGRRPRCSTSTARGLELRREAPWGDGAAIAWLGIRGRRPRVRARHRLCLSRRTSARAGPATAGDRASCSRATTSKEVRYHRTRRSGCPGPRSRHAPQRQRETTTHSVKERKKDDEVQAFASRPSRWPDWWRSVRRPPPSGRRRRPSRSASPR